MVPGVARSSRVCHPNLKKAEMLVIKDSFSALFFAHTASHNKQHSKCILFGIFYHSTEVELIGKMYAILPLLILP